MHLTASAGKKEVSEGGGGVKARRNKAKRRRYLTRQVPEGKAIPHSVDVRFQKLDELDGLGDTGEEGREKVTRRNQERGRKRADLTTMRASRKKPLKRGVRMVIMASVERPRAITANRARKKCQRKKKN